MTTVPWVMSEAISAATRCMNGIYSLYMTLHRYVPKMAHPGHGSAKQIVVHQPAGAFRSRLVRLITSTSSKGADKLSIRLVGVPIYRRVNVLGVSVDQRCRWSRCSGRWTGS
jgi:hypothetical protein